MLLLLLAWFGLAPRPWTTGGVAAEPPVCTAATSGTVACIANRLCRCGFERGGSMLDEPAGHRWDCGVRRPYCDRPPTLGERREPPTELDLVLPAPRIRDLEPPGSRPLPKPPRGEPDR